MSPDSCQRCQSVSTPACLSLSHSLSAWWAAWYLALCHCLHSVAIRSFHSLTNLHSLHHHCALPSAPSLCTALCLATVHCPLPHHCALPSASPLCIALCLTSIMIVHCPLPHHCALPSASSLCTALCLTTLHSEHTACPVAPVVWDTPIKFLLSLCTFISASPLDVAASSDASASTPSLATALVISFFALMVSFVAKQTWMCSLVALVEQHSQCYRRILQQHPLLDSICMPSLQVEQPMARAFEPNVPNLHFAPQGIGLNKINAKRQFVNH